MEFLSPEIEESLKHRLGAENYQRRLDFHVRAELPVFGRSAISIPIEYAHKIEGIMRWVVAKSGMLPRGMRNAHRILVRERRMAVHGLPAPFIGWRILHLSDLHLTDHPSLADTLLSRLAGLSYDVAVVTGDFCEETYGDNPQALRHLERVLRSLTAPAYGILGNHDLLKTIPLIETMGLRLLLNEHVPVEKEGARIYLAGVDDPHMIQNADMPHALQGIPPDSFIVLLSHSAELYRKASAAHIGLMLCGHTHGGQICFPGKIPLFYSARTPRSMVSGFWRYRDLSGYTSPGLGTSMVPVRFYCPPEIIVHILEQA